MFLGYSVHHCNKIYATGGVINFLKMEIYSFLYQLNQDYEITWQINEKRVIFHLFLSL